MEFISLLFGFEIVWLCVSVFMGISGVVEESPEQHRLFVYGSLLDDEVVRALLKRVPSSSPAVLHNYHRFSVKGCSYPAILPMECEEVIGKVLFAITDLELNILDAFEDFEYEKREVEVTMIENLEKVTAYTYVWVNENDPKLYGGWSFDEWKQLQFEDFLQMTNAFMLEMKQFGSTRLAMSDFHYQDSETSVES